MSPPPSQARTLQDPPAADQRAGPSWSVVIRSTVFNALFYVNIIVLMLVGLPSVVMGRGPAMFMARTWAATSLWLLRVVCGTSLEFRGLENLPRGGVVIAPKHQSILETFALVLKVPDFSYVLKRELNWIPLFGWYLMAVQQIAIDRSSGATALAQVTSGVARFLKTGRAIFIFPEGTRRPVGAPPRYKYGVTHLYTTLDAPVLPVALNTGVFWPRRSYLRRPGTAVIEFLPVIPPGLERDEFAALLQATIETQTDRLVAEAIDKDPSLAAAIGGAAPRGRQT